MLKNTEFHFQPISSCPDNEIVLAQAEQTESGKMILLTVCYVVNETTRTFLYHDGNAWQPLPAGVRLVNFTSAPSAPKPPPQWQVGKKNNLTSRAVLRYHLRCDFCGYQNSYDATGEAYEFGWRIARPTVHNKEHSDCRIWCGGCEME